MKQKGRRRDQLGKLVRVDSLPSMLLELCARISNSEQPDGIIASVPFKTEVELPGGTVRLRLAACARESRVHAAESVEQVDVVTYHRVLRARAEDDRRC